MLFKTNNQLLNNKFKLLNKFNFLINNLRFKNLIPQMISFNKIK